MKNTKNVFSGKISSQKGIVYNYLIWIICLIVLTPILLNEIISMYEDMGAIEYVFNYKLEDVITLLIGVFLVNFIYKNFTKNKMPNNLKLLLINITFIILFFLGSLVMKLYTGSFLFDAYGM